MLKQPSLQTLLQLNRKTNFGDVSPSISVYIRFLIGIGLRMLGASSETISVLSFCYPFSDPFDSHLAHRYAGTFKRMRTAYSQTMTATVFSEGWSFRAFRGWEANHEKFLLTKQYRIVPGCCLVYRDHENFPQTDPNLLLTKILPHKKNTGYTYISLHAYHTLLCTLLLQLYVMIGRVIYIGGRAT